MKTEEDIFRKYLKQKELKFTPERRAILDEVFSLHDHFDVETIFTRLSQRAEHISRATIYRTLPLLVGSGLIKEVLRAQDRGYYEHTFGHKHHDHMVCLKCGKAIEFKDNRIEKLQDEVCKKYGFKPVEHRLGIRGYCKECR
ncbi:MAG: Fur family transcriptional regulator [bacterium]|nr:Fur family transcriptional regulator [bacterium]